MERNSAVSVIASLFVLLWTYAAISKLSHFGVTVIGMQSLPMPEVLKSFIPWYIPIIEILLVLLLSNKGLRRFGILLSTLLMFLFTNYVAYVLGFPKEIIPCNCGGIISWFGWKEHLLFNAAWSLLGVFGLWLDEKVISEQH